jgi:uncharacterized protein YbbC (DUF1343 family)
MREYKIEKTDNDSDSLMKRVLLFCLSFLALLFPAYAADMQFSNDDKIQVGAEQIELYRPLLVGKRVGLVVNQSSLVNGEHLVDYLLQNNILVTAIFSPEHGFKGNYSAGKKIDSSQLNIESKNKRKDLKESNHSLKTIPIYSLYGKNKQPTADQLSNVDLLVFDIQDVGVRFYTYISSMHYAMKSAKQSSIPMIIFDRPNPNGGWVDGPVLESEFRSFVGMHSIPLLHGMTVAELALMIMKEGWLDTSEDEASSAHKLNLKVVPVKNYQRWLTYSLPIPPSPNLPNDIAVSLYPSLAFFEATPVSIGRGTDFPFQVIGHNKVSIGQFEFTPRSIKGVSDNPKLLGQKVTGQDLRQSQFSGLSLAPLLAWHDKFQRAGKVFFTRARFFDQLAGTAKLRMQILSGNNEKEIKASWQQQLNDFKERRKPYLLYSDTTNEPIDTASHNHNKLRRQGAVDSRSTNNISLKKVNLLQPIWAEYIVGPKK